MVANEGPPFMITVMQGALGLASGALVGFSLVLVGGGGSVLAIPLMVYVVGVPDAHVAIGTSAMAVATNAAVNLAVHARGGDVRWSRALVFFATAGIAGALGGSALGKMVDGQSLLLLFALLMLAIAGLMLKSRAPIDVPAMQASRVGTPALLGLGLATGTLSGFFGIGGGFLIVPAFMLASGRAMPSAIPSSLVAVIAFSLTASASYAWSGLMSWKLTALVIVGGILGGLLGAGTACYPGLRRGPRHGIFASIIILVALYMLARNIYVT